LLRNSYSGAITEHNFLFSVLDIKAQVLSYLMAGMLCSIYQRYKLKAIHNIGFEEVTADEVVLNISKIQTESNSQHNDWLIKGKEGCAQYIKDTN
jgi:hypothetical protein